MPLIVNLSGRKASFTLAGPDVEPTGDRWRGASLAERADYFDMLSRRVEAVKRQQLLNGVGADGSPLPRAKRISRLSYRRAGLPHTGPALLPQREQSRTFRYLAVQPFPRQRPNRVVGFWRAGWAQIVRWHATGTAGRGHPYYDDAGRIHWAGIPGATSGIVRNVVGLPEAYLRRAVANARRDWTRKYGRSPVPVPVRPISVAFPPPIRRRPPPRPAARP